MWSWFLLFTMLSAIERKYVLKASATLCWLFILLSPIFKDHISPLLIVLHCFQIYNIPCLFYFIIRVYYLFVMM
jgi:hypothetical protein